MKKSILKTIFTNAFLALFVSLIFYSCSSEDNKTIACTPKLCFNGGVSNKDCGCDCPEGYTGADCFDIKTPKKVLVTKIRVLSFLNDVSGTYWDSFYGQPDIYVNLIDINGSVNTVFYSSESKTDAVSKSNTVYDFILKTPIELIKVNDWYKIELWDYDKADTPSNDDDYMGSMIFIPFSKITPKDESIIVTNEKVNLKFELFLTYIY